MATVAMRLRRRAFAVLAVLPLVLNACSDSTHTPGPADTEGPTTQATATVPVATAGPSAVVPSAAPPVFDRLGGLAWIGEGPAGWLAGEIGESYRTLPEDEIGLKAQGNWILSIRFVEGSLVTLLVRPSSAADPAEVNLGDLLPSSVAISLERNLAYVSGISLTGGEALPVFRLPLRDLPQVAEPWLKPDTGRLVRNLAVTPDGSTLASSICEVNDEEMTQDRCRLELLPASGDGEVRQIGELPGFLSSVRAGVAVVSDPTADSEPAWIAAYDLGSELDPGSGKQLWQIDGQIGAWRFVRDDRLVIARFEAGEAPRFVLESVGLRDGDRKVLYEEKGDAPPSLLSDLSTDDILVLSYDRDFGFAVSEHPDGLVPVLIVDVAAGTAEPYLLPVGKGT